MFSIATSSMDTTAASWLGSVSTGADCEGRSSCSISRIPTTSFSSSTFSMLSSSANCPPN